MKYIIYLIIITNLYANCTNQQIQTSKEIYTKASQESNITKQIELLEESIRECNFPEIEATLFNLKAQKSIDLESKLIYYKQALVAVSNFDNEELLYQEQNRLNSIIANLTAQSEPEISELYRKKVEYSEDVDSSFGVWVFYFLVGGFLVYGFFVFNGEN